MIAMDTETAVQRLYKEVINERAEHVVEDLIAAEYVGHELGGDIQGVQGFKQFLGAFWTAFPDLVATIEDQVAEGDKVASRYRVRGVNRGELMGLPATGNQMEISGIEIHRFNGEGKIVEKWNVYDALGLMQQLGVIGRT